MATTNPMYHPVLKPKMAETTALGAAFAAGLAVSSSRYIWICVFLAKTH